MFKTHLVLFIWLTLNERILQIRIQCALCLKSEMTSIYRAILGMSDIMLNNWLRNTIPSLYPLHTVKWSPHCEMKVCLSKMITFVATKRIIVLFLPQGKSSSYWDKSWGNRYSKAESCILPSWSCVTEWEQVGRRWNCLEWSPQVKSSYTRSRESKPCS